MLVVVVAAFVMLVVSSEIEIVPVISADHCKLKSWNLDVIVIFICQMECR